MQFPEYMRLNFPRLMLGPALFHSWPIGIRFELNQNHWPNVEWQAVLQRACTLYETAFRPGDRGFIVSGHEFESERKQSGPGKLPALRQSVFALSRKYDLGVRGVAGRQRSTTYQDKETSIITTYRWAEMEGRRIGYQEILRAVMHTDFPSRSPRIQDRVYFINRDRDIILHMYDDRGMDLIAPSTETLRTIYHQHKDWVLEYDRASTTKLFEPVADQMKDES
jgi:hypothetical protein